MQAIEKASASVETLVAGGAELTGMLQGATGVADDTKARLKDINDGLAGAASDLSAAVNAMSAANSTGDDKKRKASAEAARKLLVSAETKKRDAATKLISVQDTRTDSAVADIVNKSNATLAGVEKAQVTAKAAADESAKGASKSGELLRVLGAAFLLAVPWTWFTLGYKLGQPIDPTRLPEALSGLSAIVVVFGLLAIVAVRDKNGLFGPIIGTDNRLSTSKAQIAAWTLAVGYAIAYLLARAVWTNTDAVSSFPTDRLDEYLVLLGGPFAAAVFAKLTVAWKVDSGAIQKTEAITPSAGQLVQDDSGNVDLVDSQYLLFNLIALGYFVLKFAQSGGLPEIPPFIYGLTGAAAASYAANKAVERNAPIITSVSPRTVRPGDEVRVAGVNFYAGVENPKAEQAVVLIEGHAEEITPKLPVNTDVLRIDIPSTLTAGSKTLTVRTAARVISGAAIIEVVESAPVVFGPKAALVPGRKGVLLGRNFLTPGSTATSEPVVVRIGTFAAEGTATSTGVEFDVPDDLPTDAQAALSIVRGTAASVEVMVQPTPPD